MRNKHKPTSQRGLALLYGNQLTNHDPARAQRARRAERRGRELLRDHLTNERYYIDPQTFVLTRE